MRKVVPQVMEDEIMDICPLVFRRQRLQRAKPVVNSFLGKALTTLRRNDVSPFSISTRLQILIEWLSSVVYEIDIAPLTSFIANMQPSDFRTNMGIGSLELGDNTDPASRPVAECENDSTASILLLLGQRTQNIALIH